MEVDWDLHAVVRACCSTASAAPTTTGAGADPSWFPDAYNHQKRNSQDENFIAFFQGPFRDTRNDNSIEQFLNVLNNPLEFPKLQKPPQSPPSLPISPLSVLGGLQDPPLVHRHRYQQHQQTQLQGQQQSFGLTRCTTSNAQSTKAKKRKGQTKRVCQVPAEGLSSDLWSWRKYGQKPIKGSPYPRGYYRCSTSKVCLARKQVERNRSDPEMFIVTYTGEHSHPVPTHRNSLAGSTRSKPKSSVEKTPATSQSPETEKAEDNDTDDDNFEPVMDDDFFDGLDELVSPVTGENSPATSPPPFPWLSNNVATTSATVAGGS